MKAAAEAKRQEAERKVRGSDPALPAVDAGSADAQGLVRQIVSEASGGALSANALVGAAGESSQSPRHRLLEDTAAFEPVELDEKNASFSAEHVVVRPSVAALQQVAASIANAREEAPQTSAQPPAAQPAPAQPAAAPVVITPSALAAAESVSDVAVTTPFIRPDISSTGTPTETEDEPSDGIIRSTLEGPDPAELARQALRSPPGVPEHDGPPVKETTGEIRQVLERQEPEEPDLDEPSVVIKDQAAIAEVQAVQADLGAATAAAMAAATAAASHAAPAAKPPADMASASQEAALSGVRRDAVAFTDAEEDFFNKAESHTHSVSRIESFDDLDEGYEPPPSFWERVFGKKKKK